MKSECSVVRDLLPLYIEHMVSEETAQYIGNHLMECEACRAEADSLRDTGMTRLTGDAPAADRENANQFRKLMKRLNLRLSSLSYAVIVIFIFLGYSLMGPGSDLMYNSLIMPAIGVFGYLAFRWKAVFHVPLLLLIATFAAYLLDFTGGMIDLGSVLPWTLIYSIFALAGIALAGLLHLAFGKYAPKNRRARKIAALCGALVLITGIGVVANALVGNPVSRLLAENTAKEHLAAQYPDTDYELASISYSFKDTCYFAEVTSPDRIDGDFTLCISMSGRLLSDNYNGRVLGHGNIAERLDFAYREQVAGVLESPVYPYSIDLGFGELCFSYRIDEEPAPGAVELSDLVNDRLYNLSELGKTNGRLVLYIDSDTVTPEKTAEILLTTRQLLDDAGISFYSVTLTVRYPRGAEQTRPDGSIRLCNFLYSDIYEEGLVERVRAASEEELS